MKNIPESIMIKRRIERLRHLTFFMNDARMPPNASRIWSRSACLNLLTGYFSNSHWRTALWVTREAIGDSYMKLTITLWLLWHRTILRQSEDTIDELLMKG